ncbi:hypothetical protein BKA70DRAFT_624734 [Coprinopsis sp. MPI-PUGE-AT-0042]|nr:hypothetical protein BKA70DRAFT_624734 [Coprinopsis sp. MPI-PUGE-AT-0042]
MNFIALLRSGQRTIGRSFVTSTTTPANRITALALRQYHNDRHDGGSGGGSYSSRPPRDTGGYSSRPPRDGGGYQSRTTRDDGGGYQSRPPRDAGGYQPRTPYRERERGVGGDRDYKIGFGQRRSSAPTTYNSNNYNKRDSDMSGARGCFNCGGCTSFSSSFSFLFAVRCFCCLRWFSSFCARFMLAASGRVLSSFFASAESGSVAATFSRATDTDQAFVSSRA